MVCGFAICVAALTTDTSASAGSRLYDMNRLLSQPHPYQKSQVAAPPVPAHSLPPGPGVRRFHRNTGPLPGSQYRLSIPTPIGSPSPIYAPRRPAGLAQAPAAQRSVGSNDGRSTAQQRPVAETGSRSWISELVAGGFVHDPGQDNNEANTFDLNLEIIFRKVTLLSFENRYLRFFFSPNPILGGTINSDNETHTVYLGLNWQHRFENDIFLGGSFGFTYHTGNLDQAEEDCPAGTTCSLPGNRRFVDTGDVTLGSRILFRESIEMGYWFAQRHALSIYFAHMSNASLFDEDNDGMNFVGLRYRYSLD